MAAYRRVAVDADGTVAIRHRSTLVDRRFTAAVVKSDRTVSRVSFQHRGNFHHSDKWYLNSSITVCYYKDQ